MEGLNEEEIANQIRTAICEKCQVNEYLIAGVEWKRGDPLWGGSWREHPDLMICKNCDEIQISGIVISLHARRKMLIEGGFTIDESSPYYLEPADE